MGFQISINGVIKLINIIDYLNKTHPIGLIYINGNNNIVEKVH